MLPDFPKIKRKYIKALNSYLRKRLGQDPLFSQVREEHHFEGNKMSYCTVTGEFHQSGYQEAASSPIEIKREDIIKSGIKAYLNQFDQIVEELEQQKAQALFSKIREVTDKTGNVVDAKGKPLDLDVYLEVLKKIEIEFAEDGNPRLPTMVTRPEEVERIKKLVPAWLSDPRFAEVIEMKRKEWDDRESNRKLVD